MNSNKPISRHESGRGLRIVAQLQVAALATCLYAMAWLVIAVVGSSLALGLQPMLIGSGSMSPAIRTGDVALIAPTDGVDLAPGTVITYRDHALGGRVVTHRIFDVTPDGSYVTKGDANATPDSDLVVPADVIGTGRLLVPYAGLPAHWLHQGEWLPLSIWLAATIAALASILPSKHEPRDPPRESTGSGGADRGSSERRPLARVAFSGRNLVTPVLSSGRRSRSGRPH